MKSAKKYLARVIALLSREEARIALAAAIILALTVIGPDGVKLRDTDYGS